MIKTWKLWAALHELPQYRMTLREQDSVTRHKTIQLDPLQFLWGIMLFALGICSSIVFPWLPLGFILLVLLTNSIFGAFCTAGIGHKIALEKQENRYDLLGSLPGGQLQANWSYALAYLHLNRYFVVLPYIVKTLVILLLIPLIGGFIIGIFQLSNENVSALGAIANLEILPLFIFGIAFVIGFYIDLVQSILAASFIGVMVASRTERPTHASLWGLLLFLPLQIMIYGITIWVSLIVLPSVLPQVPLPDITISVIHAVIGLSIFYGLRELVIWMLLIALKIQNNNDYIALEDVIRQVATEGGVEPISTGKLAQQMSHL